MNRIFASGGPSPGTPRVAVRYSGHFSQLLTSLASAASSSITRPYAGVTWRLRHWPGWGLAFGVSIPLRLASAALQRLGVEHARVVAVQVANDLVGAVL